MTTLGDVLTAMGGGHLDLPDQATALAAAVTDTTGTTITAVQLAVPVQVGATLEVDNELMRVRSFARAGSNDTYTVIRGVDGSAAATHSNGAPIFVNPKYPRWKRIRAVNRALTEWVPQKLPRVQQDATQLFTVLSDVIAVPAATIDVLQVNYKPPGFTQLEPLRYSSPRAYPVAIASTGKGVKVYGDIGPPGYTVYTTYTTLWGSLAADTDALPAEWVFGVDMLAAGATAALLGAKFTKRATFDSAHTQRGEDKAGQSQKLTQDAAGDAMQEFLSLVAGYMQTYEGARQPVYWQG
jgi:hypothetical protein